jgi:hypothetical protein
MHPSEVLFQGTRQPLLLPACDHYAGSEKLMRKSMALQQELGPCSTSPSTARTAPRRQRRSARAPGRRAGRFRRQQIQPHRRARARCRQPSSRPTSRSSAHAAGASSPISSCRKSTALPTCSGARHQADRQPRAKAGRNEIAGARADRDARRAARRLRHRRPAPGRMPVVRHHGFRLRALRRDSGQRHAHARASSRTRWWCAPSWKSPPPATPTARSPSHNVTTEIADTAVVRQRRPARRRRIRLHAHVEHPPEPDQADRQAFARACPK